MKYGETFYGHHMALNTSCSEVKYKSKWLPLEAKNTHKRTKIGARFDEVFKYTAM